MIVQLPTLKGQTVRVCTTIPPRLIERVEALVEYTLSLPEAEREQLIELSRAWMRAELMAGRVNASIAISQFLALLVQEQPNPYNISQGGMYADG